MDCKSNVGNRIEEENFYSYNCLINFYKKLIGNEKIWLFRGQSDSTWPLETTLERALLRYIGYEKKNNCEGQKNHKLREKLSQVDNGKDIFDYERSLIREFKRKASIYIKTPEDDRYLEWISLMRHYGAPVRILDCTYSFYVALYDAIKDSDGECAIYAFDQKLFGKEIYNSLFPYKNEVIEHLITSSIEADKKIGIYFDKPGYTFVCNVTPFNHNERISVQQGSFLLPGNIKCTFMDNLNKNITIFKNIYKNENTPVKKIIFSCNPKKRRKIIEKLFRMNITSHTLTPDLTGFCETLKVRFNYFDFEKHSKKEQNHETSTPPK